MKFKSAFFFLLLPVFILNLLPSASVRAQSSDEDAMLKEDLAPYLEKEETARWSLTNPFSEELVQTAEKQVQTIKNTPASIDVITGEEIKRYGYPTLTEFLSTLPGFYYQYPRDYRVAGVRGVCRQGEWNNRILILVDGHSLNSDFDGSSFSEEDFGVSLDGVDKIEIVRGPGSTLYGTNALLAVVNIITKSGDKIDGVQGKAGVASYRTGMAGGAYGKKFGNKVDVLLSGQFLDSDGRKLYYPEFSDTPSGGHTDNTDYLRNWTTFGKVSFGDFSLKFLAKDRKKGLPQAAYFTIFDDKNNYVRDSQGFTEARWDPSLTSSLTLSSRAYLDFVHYNGLFAYEDEVTPLQLEGWNDWYGGGELKLNWKQSRLFKLLGGAEYQFHHDNFWLKFQDNDRNTVPDTGDRWAKNTSWEALFLQGKLEPWSNFNVNVGLRYDHFPLFGGELNPRAGLIYSPYSTGTIKLLYGQAFRAPSRYEYDYTDLLNYLPNHTLKPEKLYTYELVLEQALGQTWFFSASGYYTEIRNLIGQAEISGLGDVQDQDNQEVQQILANSSEGLIQFQNSGKIRSGGAELSARAKWRNGINGFANLTIQKSQESNQGETYDLDISPRLYGNLGANFPVPYLTKNLFFATNLQFSGERNIPGTADPEGKNPLKTGAYLLTNVNLSWKDLPKGLETSLGIYNLFNVKYSFPGGGDFPENRIRADGINFRFLVSYLIK